MKTCPDCGCRVYNLGCVNCNEIDYIEEQNYFDEANAADAGCGDGDTQAVPSRPNVVVLETGEEG